MGKLSQKLDESILIMNKSALSRSNPDGSIVILLLNMDDYFFTLDKVAAEFFRMIDGKRSIGEITQSLSKKHLPPPGILEMEITKLVQKLIQEKIVSIQTAAS